MRKLKFSFAFVLMFFLVGMYSAVALAAGSNPPNPATGITTPGTDVIDGIKATTDDSAHDNGLINDNNTGSGVGGQAENFNGVIKSDDNGISGPMVKNDGTMGTQRTHGSYMNNTNSCASCHQTHTGAGASLLFKDSQYATCTACHDGTLGFYNVMGPGSNSAGTFSGTHDGNMSAHLANSSVKISAAPGGNHTSGDKDGEGWNAEFSCASCHAPHGSYSDRLLNEDPNGMANIPASEGGKKLENIPVVTTTDFLAGATQTIQNGLGDTTTANFVLYRFTYDSTFKDMNKYSRVVNGAKITVNNYSDLTTGDTVLQLMKWNGTSYAVEQDPFIHEYEFDANHNKMYWTKFSNGTKIVYDTDQLKNGEILGGGFVAAQNGSASVTTVNSITTADLARAYTVNLAISATNANNESATTVSALWNASGADKAVNISNNGVKMSTFCAACHTDYFAKSGSATGTFSHAYRHTTTSDSYTCVRCHFAHGTDVTVMRDARGLTFDQIKADTTNYPLTGVAGDRDTQVRTYLIDKNPSSALKRYTNMAVCWGCHTSSHSGGTRNTDSYKYDANPGIATDRNGITDY